MSHTGEMAWKNRHTAHAFGKIVIEARERKGWSRYRLIAESGRPAAQVYALEKGRNEPTIGTIIWVAEALGMDPTELFRTLCLALREEQKATNAAARDEPGSGGRATASTDAD